MVASTAGNHTHVGRDRPHGVTQRRLPHAVEQGLASPRLRIQRSRHPPAVSASSCPTHSASPAEPKCLRHCLGHRQPGRAVAHITLGPPECYWPTRSGSPAARTKAAAERSAGNKESAPAGDRTSFRPLHAKTSLRTMAKVFPFSVLPTADLVIDAAYTPAIFSR